MLVQMNFSEVLGNTEMHQGYAMCRKCGKEVGPIGLDELRAMMSGKYGDVLCFDCEDWPPQPVNIMSARVRNTLLKLFQLQNPADLPLHAYPYWTNERFDVALQLSMNFGWCFWIFDPDARCWQLRRVAMVAREAVSLKEAYVMVPVEPCK